jgi:hypothetical protein
VQVVGIVVISTDRGLCGSLNLPTVQGDAAPPSASGRARAQGVPVRDRLQGAAILPAPASTCRCWRSPHSGRSPHIKELIGTVKVMLDFYREAKIDQLLLVHNAVRQHHDAEGRQALAAAAAADRRQGRAAGALGLHLRAGRAEILDGC